MQTGQASLLPGVPALLSDERRRSPLSNFRCLLLRFDFHLARFRSFFLRKSHREYTVVKLGADLVGVERVRHCKTPDKVAVAALDPVEALGRLLFVELALAGD